MAGVELLCFFLMGKITYWAWKDGAKKTAVVLTLLCLAAATFSGWADYCIVKHLDLFTGRPW